MFFQAFLRILGLILCLWQLVGLSYLSYASDIINITNDKNKVLIEMQLEPSTYIYWHQQSSVGLPTIITLEDQTNIQSYDIDWPWPEVKNTTNGNIAYYSKKITIPLYIKPVNKDINSKCKIVLSYLSCSNQVCAQRTFSDSIFIGDYYFNATNQQENIENIFYDSGNVVISTSTKGLQLIAKQGYNIYTPDRIMENNPTKYFFDISKFEDGNIEFFNNYTNNIKSFYFDKAVTINPSWKMRDIYMHVFLLAFLGGFILNFMPCVLPVLAIKMYGLVHYKSYNERRAEALISICVIITYFLIIGCITALAKQSGKFFGFGTILQIPVVIILAIIFITLMICALRNKVNIGPTSDFLSKYKSSNKYINSAFITLGSTILATPCTGPFLASSVTFALNQPLTIILMIFLSAGFGFSFPYMILIIWPDAINLMPKSGAWQSKVKILFILLLLTTILWLSTILVAQVGLLCSLFILSIILVIFILYEKQYKYSYRALLILTIVSLCAPSLCNKFTKTEVANTSSYFEDFSYAKLNQYLKQDEIILVYATARWCMTCQINKIMVLNKLETQKLFKHYRVRLLEADITAFNEEAEMFLEDNNAPGIPFTILYGSNNKTGIVMPSLLSYSEMYSAILTLNGKSAGQK